MKKLKKIFVISFAILIVVMIISIISNYCFVVPISKVETNHLLVEGDTVNPLKGVDLEKGKWKAYLTISHDDFDNLHPSIEKASCLKTEDLKVLKRIQRDWNGIISSSDLATVESFIYIFKDDQLFFKSGIVLDEHNQGLQSPDYGWISPVDSNALIATCKTFKKVYWPIVLL